MEWGPFGKKKKIKKVTACREFKCLLGNSKIQAWQKFASGVNGPKAAAKLFKSVQAEENRSIECLASSDHSPDGSLNLFMDTHFLGNLPMADDSLPVPLWLEDPAIPFLNEDNFIWCSKSFRPLTVPGPDGIKPLFMNRLGPNL